MVTPLCPLCMGLSQINSLTAQTLSKNQTLHGYVACNCSYGHFCDIFAYFGQNLVAMATSLRPVQSRDPCNQKCLLWIARPRKPPVISNHILVISHSNAFTGGIRIYSNFSPKKTGCHGNAPLSLLYGGVTDEFPDSRNPISKQNYTWICRIQLKL